jgi:hypothetical protein
MPSSTATVATDRPARYLKQLASHFSQRANGEIGTDHARVDFDFGTLVLDTADGSLVMRAEAADPEALARVEDVAARHLIRFGQKDELQVEWTPEL